MAPPSKKSASATAAERDEIASHREIATLLLNLASNNGSSGTVAAAAEDLSVKPAGETAMDLTKTKAEISVLNTPLPASISKLVSGKVSMNGIGGVDLTTSTNGASVSSSSFNLPNAAAAAAAPNVSSSASNPYSSFYPSLASIAGLTPSTLATMNSNYLLQNILLGKMQQIASAAATTTTSSSTSSSTSSPLSFPTQPIPAQALSIPSASSLKPPMSVLKSANATTTSPPSLPNAPLADLSTAAAVAAAASTSTNIPLLCGQIVAQLNGLLFLVHSLNNAQVEADLQTQLTAIYTRLQEVVVIVEQAKKQQEDQKDLKVKQLDDEEKIAKHIQDYQRALLDQQIAPLKETPGMASNSVVNMLKKQAQANLEAKSELGDESMHEAESTSSAAARRRRGRPPKSLTHEINYSPPEKRSRGSLDNPTVDAVVAAANAASSNAAAAVLLNNHLINGAPNSTAGDLAVIPAVPTSNGKGSGKGIRNRVFCGECSGCLKNDDCGRCRYCQDKTKFGGQNRLRQKCLHRRCQMDTHRKRNGSTVTVIEGKANTAVSNTGENAGNSFKDSTAAVRSSPSPNAIYSGVDLARLAATAVASKAEGKGVDKVETSAPSVTVELKKNGEKEEAKAEEKKIEEKADVSITLVENNAKGGDPETEVRRKTRSSSQKERSLSVESNGENHEDYSSEDEKGAAKANGKSQSRIDRWKQKHEAMLKLADEGKKKSKKAKPEQPESEEDAEEEDEPEPELPEIEPNGVCIDIKGSNNSKPHTRHSAAVQQQALSV